MHPISWHRRPFVLLALLLAALTVPCAHAAQDYDSCTGYIDSLPASISTQGTWCLRGHKYTSQSSGAAINVLTDNVTIDCNHFRVSGYGAGRTTDAIGITAGASRINATVRRCRIQGFKYGVVLYGAHHLVDGNRFDGNTHIAILANGDGNVVRANVVLFTGGRPEDPYPRAIVNGGSAITEGNIVHGVVPGNAFGPRQPTGIEANGLVQDNYVSGLGEPFNAPAVAIQISDDSAARRNTVIQATPTAGYGIDSTNLSRNCRDNNVINFSGGIDNCGLVGANLVLGATQYP